MARTVWCGWETGDLSESSGNYGTNSVVTSPVFTGNYAFKVDGSATGGGSTYLLPAEQSTIFARIYFQYTGATNGNPSFFEMDNAGGANVIYSFAVATSTKKIRIFEGDSFTNLGDGQTTLVAGTWYLIEMKAVIAGGGGGSVEVRVNGVVDQSDAGRTNNGSGNVAQVQCYCENGVSAPTCNYFFDNLAVDDAAYPGAGFVIARQGRSGPPTYDSWTKNGAATSALCWSDTPFSTATNCSDSTQNDRQTMLVWPFNTTQTDHGTEIIGPLDTINACKVSVIAKSDVAGNMDILRRIDNVDTTTTVALSTSDAYFQSAFFTAAANSLNSAEIGAVNDLVATLVTVEDAWLQVEYLTVSSTYAEMDTPSPFMIRRFAPTSY